MYRRSVKDSKLMFSCISLEESVSRGSREIPANRSEHAVDITFLCFLFVFFDPYYLINSLAERRSSNSKVAGSRPSRVRQYLSVCAGYGNDMKYTLENIFNLLYYGVNNNTT